MFKLSPYQYRAQGSTIIWDRYSDNDTGTIITGISPIKSSLLKKTITIMDSALLAFLPLLLLKWFPKIRKNLFYSNAVLQNATHFYVQDTGNKAEICPTLIKMYKQLQIQTFAYRFLPFYWSDALHKFIPAKMITYSTHTEILNAYSKGFKSIDNRVDAKILYGKCKIEVPIKPCFLLLIEEIITPFYIFQMLSIILWILEKYYWYAIVLIVMAGASIVHTLFDKRQNLIRIYNIAKNSTRIFKKDTLSDCFHEINSEQLVPGDIIQLYTSLTMPCDAIMLSGVAVVNESMLTGECSTVSKHPLNHSNEVYNSDTDKKNTIFSGTRIVSVDNTQIATALVIRTGYLTTKGSLIRSILYPRNTKAKFDIDILKYILVMGGIALIGFCFTIKSLIDLSLSSRNIVLRCLDLIVIAIPPALPTVLTVATSLALRRLRSNHIYCIDQNKINDAGRIGTTILDKTGTLTEKSHSLFKMYYCLKINNAVILKEDSLKNIDIGDSQPTLYKYAMICMACCHSLAKMKCQNTSSSEVLIGDPLEVEMFSYTKCIYSSGTDLGSLSTFFIRQNMNASRYLNFNHHYKE